MKGRTNCEAQFKISRDVDLRVTFNFLHNLAKTRMAMAESLLAIIQNVTLLRMATLSFKS
jgi:hypothetical protein